MPTPPHDCRPRPRGSWAAQGHRPPVPPHRAYVLSTGGPHPLAIREMICSDSPWNSVRRLWPKRLPTAAGATSRVSYRGQWSGNPVTIRYSWSTPPRARVSSRTLRRPDIELLAKDMGKSVAESRPSSPPCTSSTHDGPPRLPSGRHLPGDRRHADPSRHPCRHQCPEDHPDWNMVPEIMIPWVGEVKELIVRQERGGQDCRRGTGPPPV